MIKLKSPKRGDTVELLTDIQIKFLKSDRTNVTVENFDYLNLRKSESGDYSFPKGIIFEWEADGEGSVQISTSEDFKNCLYSKSACNSCCVENLKCGTRYFWRVVSGNEVSEVFCFNTADIYPRFIKIDGITNVRDCGGWKTIDGGRIKQGLLYRGSEMNSHVSITDEGLKTMREVLEIKSVMDLRWYKEVVKDVYKGGYVNISVAPYSEWFEKPEVTRAVFEYLSDKENYPVYFHCWGGADRTGTMAFLIGALLGQSYEDLIDDYEITSLSIWGARSRNSELCRGFLEAFNALEGESISEKAKKYLLSCGVSEKQINDFKNIMLV